jgi:cytochrome c553
LINLTSTPSSRLVGRRAPVTGAGRGIRLTAAVRAGLAAAALLCAGPAAAQQPDGVVDLIAEACAPCHGEQGIAKSIDVPNLAGQHNVYLYHQLRAFRAKKRQHKDMLYMSRQLTDEEMRAIADYYASLPPR